MMLIPQILFTAWPIFLRVWTIFIYSLNRNQTLRIVRREEGI